MLSITVAIFNSCVLCYCSKQKKIVGNFSPKKIETKCDIFLFHTNHVRFNRQFPKDNIYIFFWETSNSTNSKADNVLIYHCCFFNSCTLSELSQSTDTTSLRGGIKCLITDTVIYVLGQTFDHTARTW